MSPAPHPGYPGPRSYDCPPCGALVGDPRRPVIVGHWFTLDHHRQATGRFLCAVCILLAAFEKTLRRREP